MGQKIDIDSLRARAEVGSNSQVLRIEVVQARIDQIITRVQYESLFPIDERTLKGVLSSIRKRGFDPHNAPDVMRETTEQGTKYLVIDGHTRLRAAKELGLPTIPVRVLTFSSDEEALSYAMHKQIDRRNLNDAQLLLILTNVDKKVEGFRGDSPLAPVGANGEGESKTAARTAHSLGVSTRKVERARKVMSDPEVSAEVKQGKISINTGYELIRAKEREQARGESTEKVVLASQPSDLTAASPAHSGAVAARKEANTEIDAGNEVDWASVISRLEEVTGTHVELRFDAEIGSGTISFQFLRTETLFRLTNQLCV